MTYKRVAARPLRWDYGCFYFQLLDRGEVVGRLEWGKTEGGQHFRCLSSPAKLSFRQHRSVLTRKSLGGGRGAMAASVAAAATAAGVRLRLTTGGKVRKTQRKVRVPSVTDSQDTTKLRSGPAVHVLGLELGLNGLPVTTTAKNTFAEG
ncbi:hypothetical protein J6590_010342 [Homalodisca vitripennis]|nr:hypothetical protein J6590_010342 [Homalodisca vitripennis]